MDDELLVRNAYDAFGGLPPVISGHLILETDPSLA